VIVEVDAWRTTPGATCGTPDRADRAGLAWRTTVHEPFGAVTATAGAGDVARSIIP
jgi:hypothetical protein